MFDKNNASILIVDDESTNLKLIDRVLAHAGYGDTVCLQDPREVFDCYAARDFDLILLDINMPHLSGYEVLEILCEKHGEDLAPVLVLTAQAAQEFRVKALNSGASDYVTKPFDRVELLARVSNLIKISLFQKSLRSENHILEQKVKERTKELYDTRLQIVNRLGLAAEYRDNETGMHIMRMSHISKLLGQAAGLSQYHCDQLLNAAPMHDIGKIGIPDSILLKPGKLDADEWETMKTHTTIGATILSGEDSDLLSLAKEIAITHHEKWDGSGYPNDLKGDDIPLVGRICALADVFDALTSERPYKKAWTVDESVDFIKENKGKHFDPNLVDLFVECLPQIVGIKNLYPDNDTEEHEYKLLVS